MAGKIGRPTKYDPAMCDIVVQCGAEGMGRYEIAAELDVSLQTMVAWEEEHPAFLSATTRARQLSQAWWEKQGRKGIWSRDFNAPAYSLQVRNRFPADWRDKHELTGSDGGPIEVSVTRRIVRADDQA
jgi:hypothetical protein